MTARASRSYALNSQMEGPMTETPLKTPQIDHVPEDSLPEPDQAAAPRIDTPLIQSQDVEHQARPETRVSNKGVKITPHLDEQDRRDFAKEDEEALRAIEEFERQYRRQAPG